MSSPHHSRWLALALSLVPGWGHVYLGRERAGLGLFTFAAVCGFVSFNAALAISGDARLPAARIAAGLGLAAWISAGLDVWRLTSPRRLKRIEAEKLDRLRGGMIAYLRGDADASESELRACLKLDGQEVEALVRLGVIASRRGDPRRARRLLRRAAALDLQGKWTWEIGRELDAMRRARSARRPIAPEGPAAAAAAGAAPSPGGGAQGG